MQVVSASADGKTSEHALLPSTRGNVSIRRIVDKVPDSFSMTAVPVAAVQAVEEDHASDNDDVPPL